MNKRNMKKKPTPRKSPLKHRTNALTRSQGTPSKNQPTLQQVLEQAKTPGRGKKTVPEKEIKHIEPTEVALSGEPLVEDTTIPMTSIESPRGAPEPSRKVSVFGTSTLLYHIHYFCLTKFYIGHIDKKFLLV